MFVWNHVRLFSARFSLFKLVSINNTTKRLRRLPQELTFEQGVTAPHWSVLNGLEALSLGMADK